MNFKENYDKNRFFSPKGKIYQMEYADVAINKFEKGGVVKIKKNNFLVFKLRKNIKGEYLGEKEDLKKEFLKISTNKFLVFFGYSSDKLLLKGKIKDELKKLKRSFGFKKLKNSFLLEMICLKREQMQLGMYRYLAVDIILMDGELDYFYYISVGGKILKMEKKFFGESPDKEIFENTKNLKDLKVEGYRTNFEELKF